MINDWPKVIYMVKAGPGLEYCLSPEPKNKYIQM